MKLNSFRARRTLRPGVVRVDARLTDFRFPAHSHDHVCIGLMQSGEKTSRYGLHRHTVQPGDVVLVNPGEVHDGRPSGRLVRRYCMLEIEADALKGLCITAGRRALPEFDQPVIRNQEIQQALRRWLVALSGADQGRESECAAAFLGRFARIRRLRPTTASDLAHRASKRLRDAAPQADCIGDLATDIGVSRYQLIRAFKATFGLTPEDYRRQLRIERARQLLTGRSSLAEVAVDAGFADQSHMNREFTRLTGLTPGRYRQAL